VSDFVPGYEASAFWGVSLPHRRHLRGAGHEHLGPERKHLRYVALEEYRVDAAKPAQRDTQITPLLPAERAEPLH